MENLFILIIQNIHLCPSNETRSKLCNRFIVCRRLKTVVWLNQHKAVKHHAYVNISMTPMYQNVTRMGKYPISDARRIKILKIDGQEANMSSISRLYINIWTAGHIKRYVILTRSYMVSKQTALENMMNIMETHIFANSQKIHHVVVIFFSILCLATDLYRDRFEVQKINPSYHGKCLYIFNHSNKTRLWKKPMHDLRSVRYAS